MDKKTIFISYGRDENNPKDVELVRKIKKDLEEEGFLVLMDEEQLRTSQYWEIKLEEMMRQSNWILFFITPYSARRPEGYCLNELAMALSYKKSIAPVMIHYEVPPLSICRLQYLDLQKLKYDDSDNYQNKLKEIVDVINKENELGFEGEHLRVLAELDPIKFETTIARHIYGFIGREWIYKEVDSWLREEEDSRVLWLVAEAGFGKSAIATYLAEKHPSALSVYFCQYDYSESKDPREMLKVLIYELSTQIDEYRKILQTLNIKEALQKSAEHIFTQLLLEPLYQINKPDKRHFFVIDALDEAVSDNKNQIVELISNRFLDLPSWLNIVITSRPEPELFRKLKKFNPVELKEDDQKNFADLELFLSKRKNITDEELVKSLIKKSEGNFLYLQSIFDLEIIKNGELTVESIEKLPDSMEGFYLQYFERRFEDIEMYEEKYLKFVSLLVVEEGLPELLIQDILKLSKREYKKIINSFGSLLIVDESKLTFYHQSIYEWLSDYDLSGDYSADMDMGQVLYSKFIDDLVAKSYREEYLEFESFNRKLVDKIYVQDKSLDRFFEMLGSINNKKKVGTIDELGEYCHYRNKTHLAIVLRKKLYYALKSLYQNSPKKWAEDYIGVLNNLAAVYMDINKTLEAKELLEQGLTISKKLYENNPTHWAELYTTILNNIGMVYSLSDDITKAIDFLEKNLDIRNELYQNDSEQWAYYYTISLNTLSMAYRDNDRTIEAIMLEEQNLDILEKLYQNNHNRWANLYIKVLDNLGVAYCESNRLPEAIKLQEKSLIILKDRNLKDSEQWSNEYVTVLANLANSYKYDDRIFDATELLEQGLVISKNLYQENPERWANLYAVILQNLAILYKDSNKTSKAIDLLEQCWQIRKNQPLTQPVQWVKYNKIVSNLTDLYKITKNKSKIRNLKKEYKDTFLTSNNQNLETAEKKIGRNDTCPCGSGKKYKKCCGKGM